ncbi:MAG: hypothetical protein OXL37_07965 [Chloroflexota bacterium]|nr:hypothetical protein [Chloroflexota bacterium]MDE2958676.1 hypothetical protein [Chloroflexota bacterium]
MLERARRRVTDFTSDWAIPISLGLAAAATVWGIWYVTKAQCTAIAAANGLCNPNAIARFIDVEILLQSGGSALAVGALKGGYNRFIMRRTLNEERIARQQAELELAEARKRNEENFARILALREEALRQAEAAREEAYRQANADREEARRQASVDREETARMFAEILNEFREERRQNAAAQQAMLDAVLRLTERNGSNSRNGD